MSKKTHNFYSINFVLSHPKIGYKFSTLVIAVMWKIKLAGEIPVTFLHLYIWHEVELRVPIA